MSCRSPSRHRLMKVDRRRNRTSTSDLGSLSSSGYWRKEVMNRSSVPRESLVP